MAAKILSEAGLDVAVLVDRTGHGERLLDGHAGQRRQQVQEEKQGKKDKALTATTQLIDAAL